MSRPTPRRFVVEHHHPIVQLMQHITSPLTGSLLIFAVHKTAQLPAARAALQSLLVRRPGAVRGALATVAAGSVAALLAHAGTFPSAPAHPQPLLPAVPPHPKLHPQPHPHMESSPAEAPEGDAVEALRLAAALESLYGKTTAPLVAQHLSAWPTSALVRKLLYSVHDGLSLPWWATIAATTLGLRLALAPLNIDLLRNSLRMKLIAPQVAACATALATAAVPPPGTASLPHPRLAAAEALTSIFVRASCSPWRGCIVFPLLLPPTILSVFGAVHDLALTEPRMGVEGALWFPDLIARDTTGLLPILSSLTWLWQVETGAGAYYAAWPNVRLCTRIAAVAFIPLTATLPSGVFVFWITSNAFAVVRGHVVRVDAVRSALRIPLARDIAALAHLPKPVPL